MLPNSANIVIIGGGVLGASAAFQLAKDGHQDIVLLDRGPLANGTTPFAAGQTAYLSASSDRLPLTTYCLDFLEHFADRTGYPIDFKQHGSLRIALTEVYLPELEAHRAAAEQLGQELQFLTPAEARERVPTLDVPEAKGVIFIPRDGYVEPKSVAVGYASAARDLGVTLQTHTKVTHIETAASQVKAVHTDRGSIQSTQVVVASGAWTRQLTQRLGLDMPVVPVRHQAYVTAPLANIAPHQPIVRLIEPQIYVQPEAGGLLVGGYGYRPISFDMNDFPDSFEIASLAPDLIYYSRLKKAATAYFPALQQAFMVQERRGLPTMTPDAKHLVSTVSGIAGLIIATGCQVGGIQSSPAIGRMVADLISGQDQFGLLSTFAADRFEANYSDAELRAQCETAYGRLYLQPH
ncbi:FAD-binding oxidoreductase [Chloroflexi bacterium TSY]|nr:FAD-binding oxidoreductase [Chloroflexi bacterium TSY]